MAYANGQLPASILAPVPGTSPRGHPLLRKDVAAAYLAMHEESMARFGVSLAIDEGTIRRTYRELSAQYLAKAQEGSNAATPGTSNHGWALATDLMSKKQRWVIDQIGEKYGFAKAWSDAAWEWWHIKWREGVWDGKRYDPLAVLTKDEHRWVRELAARRATAHARGKWLPDSLARAQHIIDTIEDRIRTIRVLDASKANRRERLVLLRAAIK